MTPSASPAFPSSSEGAQVPEECIFIELSSKDQFAGALRGLGENQISPQSHGGTDSVFGTARSKIDLVKHLKPRGFADGSAPNMNSAQMFDHPLA